MKKAKIWITTCICCLLFCITFVERSCGLGSPITDDVKVIPLLKQNIPKDYTIHIQYIQKSNEVNGMCWVLVNLYNVEQSLINLTAKFGNISSNKDNITRLILMMENMRMDKELDYTMQRFSCHYKEEIWKTHLYFDYIKEIIDTYKPGDDPDCNPPPCPTTTTEMVTTGSLTSSTKVTVTMRTTASKSATDCTHNAGCASNNKSLTTGDKENNINYVYLLLIIPLCAVVFFVLWRVRRRKRMRLPENAENTESGTLFTAPEVNTEGPSNESTPEEIKRLNDDQEV
ncbi:kit ligand a [Amia ocellicauda]|uniref:kit ligand a n=1 Tax=Amia ocellicauda TaxID=2972642 RepID=UPI003463EA41